MADFHEARKGDHYFMISLRTGPRADPSEGFEVRLDGNEEGKPFVETPRLHVAPKDEISINVTLGLTIVLFLLVTLCSMLANQAHYRGFFFGRLT